MVCNLILNQLERQHQKKNGRRPKKTQHFLKTTLKKNENGRRPNFFFEIFLGGLISPFLVWRSPFQKFWIKPLSIATRGPWGEGTVKKCYTRILYLNIGSPHIHVDHWYILCCIEIIQKFTVNSISEQKKWHDIHWICNLIIFNHVWFILMGVNFGKGAILEGR